MTPTPPPPPIRLPTIPVSRVTHSGGCFVATALLLILLGGWLLAEAWR